MTSWPRARDPRLIAVDLRLVVEQLSSRYPFSDLGNKKDPLDELVYIVLSTRTRGIVFERTYELLREVCPSWDSVLRMPTRAIRDLLAPAGLASKKTAWLHDALEEILRREGSLTLCGLNSMTDEEVEAYLLSLPGVGVKTARCIEMYSLNRDVLPVDANVRRLLERLGAIERGIHYSKIHDVAQDAVPTEVRHRLHVYAVIHGRATCTPRAPHCLSCVLLEWCPYGRAQVS